MYKIYIEFHMVGLFLPDQNRLNVKYDVLVIGAGIVGLSTAYQIKEKKPDLKILILEKEKGV
jgi:cation diffusion facilitator CzcD-associated flavoprotein CzcO